MILNRDPGDEDDGKHDPTALADYYLDRLSDPECAHPEMPTPYTDLPAFIDSAKAALELGPPADVRARIVAAVGLAQAMLRECQR